MQLGYNVWQPGISRLGSARSDDKIEKVEDLMLSQKDKPKRIDQLARFRVKLAFPGQRCIAISSSNTSNDVVLSCYLNPIASQQLYRPNKSCYCSFINRKLNNKQVK